MRSRTYLNKDKKYGHMIDFCDDYAAFLGINFMTTKELITRLGDWSQTESHINRTVVNKLGHKVPTFPCIIRTDGHIGLVYLKIMKPRFSYNHLISYFVNKSGNKEVLAK